MEVEIQTGHFCTMHSNTFKEEKLVSGWAAFTKMTLP